MRLGLTIVAVLLAGGCAAMDDAGSFDTDDFIDMDTPPGDCPQGQVCSGSSGTTGAPVGSPCFSSGQCVDEAACVAPFEDGMVGDFVCTNDCIGPMDEASWCLDPSACCDPTADCNARGLCIPGALDDTGSGSDSGSGTGADDSGSGTTASSTGGTEGSGSTGGSDTGATTGAMEGR